MALNKNAQKWVDALRSGKYKQGRLSLHSMGNEYCCLGVACELAVEDGVIAPPIPISFNRGYESVDVDVYGYGSNGCSGLLPLEVVKWLKITSSTGRYHDTSQSRNFTYKYADLATDNDSGKTFLEIADIIESHPEIFTEESDARPSVS